MGQHVLSGSVHDGLMNAQLRGDDCADVNGDDDVLMFIIMLTASPHAHLQQTAKQQKYIWMNEVNGWMGINL